MSKVKKLTERINMIRQETTYHQVLDTYCDIDFEEDVSHNIDGPSDYAIKSICTKEKGYIFKYDNNLYLLADVYFLLFGGYSTGAFDVDQIVGMKIYYPNVMYKTLKNKERNFPVPYIIIDKNVFDKLKEELKRLDNEAFELFYDKYITQKSFTSDSTNTIINSAKTINPTIANLNELVCDVKSKYKGFIAEEAIDNIMDYIAKNITVFEDDEKYKDQQDTIDSLEEEIDRLKVENNDLKNVMCCIANEISPFVREMSQAELITRTLFGGNTTKDTEFIDNKENTEVEEPKYFTDLFDNDKDFQVSNRKINQNIEISYDVLRNFIYKLQEGLFGNISKELHRQYNQSAYICVCSKIHINYKNDFGSGGIDAFQKNKLLFALANFYTYDIRKDTKEYPYIKFDNGSRKLFSEVLDPDYLEIYKNNIINVILKPLGYDITEDNISEVFDYIYKNGKLELGEKYEQSSSV